MLTGKAGPLTFIKSKGLRVPEFFTISHSDFISWGDKELYSKLRYSFSNKDFSIIQEEAQRFISSVSIPDLKLPIDKLYAVRSSSHIEDSLEHSFAGIFHTKLFVPSENISNSIKEVWSSLFETKSALYCQAQNINWYDLKMDIIIQEMIEGEKSGILFQNDPINNNNEQIIVAGLGLCQGIVTDQTDTDCYKVNEHEISESLISEKSHYLVQESGEIRKKDIPFNKQKISVLSHFEIEKVLATSEILRSHFKRPLDVEFTFKEGEIYILQVRPISTLTDNKQMLLRVDISSDSYKLRGIPCSAGEVKALCEVINDSTVKTSLAGKILVISNTDVVWEHFFSGIKGIVCEKGSMLSHAAIISRELKIPCIMNVKNATQILESNMIITMNGETGEITLS